MKTDNNIWRAAALSADWSLERFTEER